MKKLLILFFAATTVLVSCNRNPLEMKADFMYAYSTYDCLTHNVKLDYIMRVYNSRGVYRPGVRELTDTLKSVCEEIVSESFDSLYIKYDDATVKRMIYHDRGVVLADREMLHKYFVNNAVKDILDAMTMQVRTQALLNPTEEDIERIKRTCREFK